MKFVDPLVFLVSLGLLGAGIALKDPAWAMVAVGSIGCALVVGIRLLRIWSIR